eukprot:COSAG06_NODE_1481_length_9319_cov_264.596963_8_plen_104_part_00
MSIIYTISYRGDGRIGASIGFGAAPGIARPLLHMWRGAPLSDGGTFPFFFLMNALMEPSFTPLTTRLLDMSIIYTISYRGDSRIGASTGFGAAPGIARPPDGT